MHRCLFACGRSAILEPLEGCQGHPWSLGTSGRIGLLGAWGAGAGRAGQPGLVQDLGSLDTLVLLELVQVPCAYSTRCATTTAAKLTSTGPTSRESTSADRSGLQAPRVVRGFSIISSSAPVWASAGEARQRPARLHQGRPSEESNPSAAPHASRLFSMFSPSATVDPDADQRGAARRALAFRPSIPMSRGARR